MTSDRYCGGCSAGVVRNECAESFQRIGILKVHWECWSRCNLPCGFCYRTRGSTLSTADARLLIRAVSTAGAETIVFAGGDPSIRPDIGLLVAFARTLNLKIEIQTNAHSVSSKFLNILKESQLVGLSVDGPDAAVHDTFRDKPGNFDRVIQVLHLLHQARTPVIVRTVVTNLNHQRLWEIGQLLEPMKNIVRWSLLEFSAVGDGYVNRHKYEIGKDLFEKVIAEVQARFRGTAHLDVYRSEAKVGTYALITPSGHVYGTGNPTINGVFQVSGSIVRDHLSTIANSLPFSKEKHVRRYGFALPNGFRNGETPKNKS